MHRVFYQVCQHYKGKYYLFPEKLIDQIQLVPNVCTHTETGEEFVYYQQLYDSHTFWVRPKSMFEENVTAIPPRFRYVTIVSEFEKSCLLYASLAHKGQVRKFSGLPYINHPIEVAEIIRKSHPLEKDVFCAALLHDTIEDTEATYQDIVENFGKTIADIVLEVTDEKTDKRTAKQKQIDSGPHKSRGAKLVKLADKLHNCSSFCRKLSNPEDHEKLVSILCFSKAVVDGMRGTSIDIENSLDRLFEKHIPQDIDHEKYIEIYLSRT